MQTIERETEANYCEVILCFESNSWAFSTFSSGSLMQEVLDRAEKQFSVHSIHHELGNIRFKVTSACVTHDRHDYHFTKRDGRWQLARSSGEHPIFARPHAAPGTGKQSREFGCVEPLRAGA